MTNPAYDIPLTDDELKTLGELCAIQGQVEYLMIETLVSVAEISRDSARKILGSNGIRVNAEVWYALFKEKCKEEAISKKADEAYKLIQELAVGRNDFIHAIFAWDGGGGWALTGFVPGPKKFKSQGAVAIRIRNAKLRSAKELPKVRNIAADISRKLDEIEQSFMPDDDYYDLDPDNAQVDWSEFGFDDRPDDEPRS